MLVDPRKNAEIKLDRTLILNEVFCRADTMISRRVRLRAGVTAENHDRRGLYSVVSVCLCFTDFQIWSCISAEDKIDVVTL